MNLFDMVPGLRRVDPADLAEYERAMREEAIPAMLKEVENRRRLAAEYLWPWRRRQ